MITVQLFIFDNSPLSPWTELIPISSVQFRPSTELNQRLPALIQEHNEPAEKDKKRYHCWAAVGHNFKSEIYFYEVPGNTNEKMSQQVYIDQILDPIVKPWIQAHQDFVLEEDGDSGHGPGKSNIVRTWKENMGLSLISIVTILLILPL